MQINTRSVKGATILDMSGNLTIGVGDVQLRNQVSDLLRQGVNNILLNLKGVRMMDSSGLGELVRSKNACARAGVTLKLLHVEDKVAEVLEMTNQLGTFDTYDDEIDAIASFR